MKDKTLVSIVIPTYNQCDYLSETLDSVLAQSYGNVEIIVVNDGSTDNTVGVLEKYKGQVTIYHQKNKGQSSALNFGWRASSGDILGYISSDDLLSVSAVEESVKAFNDCDEAIVTYCDFSLIDFEGKHIKKICPLDYTKELITDNLTCLPGPGAFFKKRVFYKLKGWDESLSQIPDFDFWFRMCIQDLGVFVKVNTNLAGFRVHLGSGSVASVSFERSEEIVGLVKSIVDENRPKRLSAAYVVAARHHLNSGRYYKGFSRLFLAVVKNPKLLFEFNYYKVFLSGVFRRFILLLKRDGE